MLILMCSPASHLACHALHQANVLHLVQTPLSESLKFVVVLWGEPSQKDADALNCPALSFSALVEKGKQNLTSFEAQRATIAPTDLATLVYTSGTTGNPKVNIFSLHSSCGPDPCVCMHGIVCAYIYVRLHSLCRE